MNDWPILQSLLANSLADFLSVWLPQIGGESWWNSRVIEYLTPPQGRVAEYLAAGDLKALDLAALLRVADRNWAELMLRQHLRREQRSLVVEMIAIRNRYAHLTLRGVAIEDQLRDVDTAWRLLKALGSPPATVAQVRDVHRRLLLQAADMARNDLGEELEEGHLPQPPETPVVGVLPSQSTARRSESVAPSPATESATPTPQPSAPSPTTWIVNPSSVGSEVTRALAAHTYVGIDFGTSTTAVSVVRLDAHGRVASETLPIHQIGELGESTWHHLVNSVLAWRNGRLLFGRDAYRLRQELFEGRDIFSSFKMRLGIDVGPTYPESKLRRGAFEVTIEDANDAAREFFKLLLSGLRASIESARLPTDLRLTVSVPASFEANQRRDLLRSLEDAGFPSAEICFIDEPNAAFLSFLHESSRGGPDDGLLVRLRQRGANILVYDFGAGTCDVSILEVKIGPSGVRSRNRAISRFTALGGDDIDRAVARRVLMPQLLESAPSFEPDHRDIEERLIPRLQPTAERLKLAAVEWLARNEIVTMEGLRAHADLTFTDNSVPPFSIRQQPLRLARPSMTLLQFADAMEAFVSRYEPDGSTSHVFAPVANAVEKSGLEVEGLDAVLFVGGSATNPLVRTAVMNHLPVGIQAIVPTDLRTHVSQGAALHSFSFHACGVDLITPITSESIFVITRGGGLDVVVPAGAEVPTIVPFTTRLRVDRDGQSVVEIPLCVGSESKLLGLLRLQSSLQTGFSLGQELVIHATITHDKLLEVEATCGGSTVRTGLLNPMANRELSVAETRMLEAKQKFNQALLDSQSRRPPKQVVLAYAEAALEAEAFEIAAEMYIAVERIDTSENHATNICYAYSQADRTEKSKEWARRAYERHPDALTAYNLSCDAQGSERERLLRESVRLDPTLSCSLLSLGKLLINGGDSSGEAHLRLAVALMEDDLRRQLLTKRGCCRLIEAATLLGMEDVAIRAQARLDSFVEDPTYQENNLAASIGRQKLISEG